VSRIGTEKFRGLCSIGDDTTPRFADGDAVDFDHEYDNRSVFIACSAVETLPRLDVPAYRVCLVGAQHQRARVARSEALRDRRDHRARSRHAG